MILWIIRGIVMILIGWVLFETADKRYKNINFINEIKKGNTAAAVFASALIMGVLISFALLM